MQVLALETKQCSKDDKLMKMNASYVFNKEFNGAGKFQVIWSHAREDEYIGV